MASSSDVLLTFKTDTGEVTKSLADIEKALDGIETKADEAGDAVGDLKQAGKKGAVGFKVLKTAIAATGIGLLITGMAMLIQKFTENKKVAEFLETAMAGVGVVFNKITELVMPLGDIMGKAMRNPMESIKKLGEAIKQNLINRIEGLLEFLPAVGRALKFAMAGEFKKAGKVAADAAGKMVLGVEDITDKVVAVSEAVVDFGTKFVAETKKAVKASTGLSKAQQKLRDEQRDLNVAYAEAKSSMEQLKLTRDDQTKSIAERIKAAEEAAAIDLEFAAQREDIANRNVAMIEKEIRLQGDTIERQDRLAEARIAAAEAMETSAGKQAELIVSIYGLTQQQLALDQEVIDSQAAADAAAEKSAEAEAARAAKKIADAKLVAKAKVDQTKRALGAIQALNAAFAKDDEKSAERSFKRNKALALSMAVINTGQAIVNALTAGGNPIKLATGMQFVEAGIAATVGAAQIATIARSQYESPAPINEPDVSVPEAAMAAAPETPSIDLSFLGGGSGQGGMRAYVVSQEVSNSQQANQLINDQAALI